MVQTVDVYRSAAEYRRLAVDGYGVIIARGGIYTDLAAVSDSVHVMEEKIRTSDILYMLTSVRETYRGKIYVVLREHVAKKFEGAVSLFDFSFGSQTLYRPGISKAAIGVHTRTGGCRIVQRCGVDAL